ncbi:molybdenum cofactor guanylyltransferase [bacterium]|nr:molybdenum cofactor guanylyltransferase [bacterium]
MSLRFAGAVLAGGEASRMGGQPKGLLERVPGQPIIVHLLDVLSRAGASETIISANDAPLYAPLGVEVVPDVHPGLGPLSGIEAVLAHFVDDCEAVAFLPCDLPAISVAEVERLVNAYRAGPPTVHMVVAGPGRSCRQPCCCVVPTAALPAVRRSIEEDKLKIGLLWRELGMVEVAFRDPAPFHNINCPADYAAWLRHRAEP